MQVHKFFGCCYSMHQTNSDSFNKGIMFQPGRCSQPLFSGWEQSPCIEIEMRFWMTFCSETRSGWTRKTSSFSCHNREWVSIEKSWKSLTRCLLKRQAHYKRILWGIFFNFMKTVNSGVWSAHNEINFGVRLPAVHNELGPVVFFQTFSKFWPKSTGSFGQKHDFKRKEDEDE